MIDALLCLVIAVSDGDTLKVRCEDAGHNEQLTIRLAEIDAPEKRQPFGARSKDSLSHLCFQHVAIIRPVTKDRYGRTVARVECQGADAGKEQVRVGMAWAFTRYLTDAEIQRLQDAARAAHIGLWSDSGPVEPWAWRKGSHP